MVAPPWRELRVGAAAPERIRLVAKRVCGRSGPETARYAYRWQSAGEIRRNHHTMRDCGSCLPVVTWVVGSCASFAGLQRIEPFLNSLLLKFRLVTRRHPPDVHPRRSGPLLCDAGVHGMG